MVITTFTAIELRDVTAGTSYRAARQYTLPAGTYVFERIENPYPQHKGISWLVLGSSALASLGLGEKSVIGLAEVYWRQKADRKAGTPTVSITERSEQLCAAGSR